VKRNSFTRGKIIEEHRIGFRTLKNKMKFHSGKSPSSLEEELVNLIFLKKSFWRK